MLLDESIERCCSIHSEMFDISADSAAADLEGVRVLLPTPESTTGKVSGPLQRFPVLKLAERNCPGNGIGIRRLAGSQRLVTDVVNVWQFPTAVKASHS